MKNRHYTRNLQSLQSADRIVGNPEVRTKVQVNGNHSIDVGSGTAGKAIFVTAWRFAACQDGLGSLLLRDGEIRVHASDGFANLTFGGGGNRLNVATRQVASEWAKSADAPKWAKQNAAAR